MKIEYNEEDIKQAIADHANNQASVFLPTVKPEHVNTIHLYSTLSAEIDFDEIEKEQVKITQDENSGE